MSGQQQLLASRPRGLRIADVQGRRGAESSVPNASAASSAPVQKSKANFANATDGVECMQQLGMERKNRRDKPTGKYP